MPYEYRYPRPALTVDCAVFAPAGGELEVLLVERDDPPFEGDWATPGGFVDIDEPISEAAARELAEETGIEQVDLVEFGTFGTPGRDPRGRIVAVAHWALADRGRLDPRAASDARSFAWHSTEALPEMAFDHADLVREALASLRSRARVGAVGRGVLDDPFSIDELRDLYDTVLADSVSAGDLREALAERTGAVRASEASGTPDPSDAVYSFDDTAYDRLRRNPISSWID